MKTSSYMQNFINEIIAKQNMTNDSNLQNLVSTTTYQNILKPILDILNENPFSDYETLKTLIIEKSNFKNNLINFIQNTQMAPGLVLGLNIDSFRGIFFYGRKQEFIYLNNKKIFNPVPIKDDTIFDLASTSKLFTCLAILKLMEEKIINLDDDITYYVPEAQNLKNVTIYDLLKFKKSISTSIRIDHANRKEEAETILFSSHLDEENKFNAYTDIGAMMLRYVVERACQMPFTEFVTETILKPLNMQDTYLNVPYEKIDRVASDNFTTTIDILGNAHTETKITPGIPHDSKSRAMGHEFGIAPGHAGYFSTAYDMLTLGRALTNHTILKADTIATISQNEVGKQLNNGFSWYYGSLVYTKQPTDGKIGVNNKLSGQAFMSPGYAGTTLVVDPLNNITCFLGANRLHDRISSIHQSQRENIITNPETHRQTFRLKDGTIKNVSITFAKEKETIIDEAINLAFQLQFLDYITKEKGMSLTRK